MKSKTAFIKSFKSDASGNALFIIMIAVALFIALSFTVERTQFGLKQSNYEDDLLLASGLLQYVSAMEDAIGKMMLVNDCEETELSFNHDSDGDGNYIDADDIQNNPNAPTDYRCHLFHPNGGGVKFLKYSEQSYADAPYASNNGHYFRFWPATVLSVGDDNKNDLIVTVNGIDKNVCYIIHEQLGIDLPSGEVPNDAFTSMASSSTGAFEGDFADDNIAVSPHAVGDGASATLDGQKTGCGCEYSSYTGTTCSNALFYHVLLTR